MAYSFYRTITIDHTKCGASNSSNFTIVVTGTYTYLKTVANGGLVRNSSGFDIGFFSDILLTTPLNWETVVYTATTGLVEFWVKIPTVSHTVDTVIYMAYDDASIVSFQGGSHGSAWDSANRIYHFPDGSSLSGADSSSINAPLTIHSATAVAGQIDGATGTASGQYLHDDALINSYPGPPLTFSVWIKTTQAVNAPFATFGRDTGSNQCSLYLFGASGLAYISEGGTFSANHTTTVVNDGNWHYLVGVLDNSAGPFPNTRIYCDGALQGTESITWNISILSATDNLTVGRLGGGLQPMTASQDEIHIISTNRGADWILTEYNNQFNPGTFYTVGAQQGSGGGGVLFNEGSFQIGNPGLRY